MTNCPTGWGIFLLTCLVPQEARTVALGCQAARVMGYKFLVSLLEALLKDSLWDSGQVFSSMEHLPEDSK